MGRTESSQTRFRPNSGGPSLPSPASLPNPGWANFFLAGSQPPIYGPSRLKAIPAPSFPGWAGFQRFGWAESKLIRVGWLPAPGAGFPVIRLGRNLTPEWAGSLRPGYAGIYRSTSIGPCRVITRTIASSPYRVSSGSMVGALAESTTPRTGPVYQTPGSPVPGPTPDRKSTRLNSSHPV